MTVNNAAIQVFLVDRKDGATHHNGRFIIKKNHLHYVDKNQIGFWTRFKAKMGCGNASMKKIVDFVDLNRDSLFNTVDDKTAFNTFITRTYNPRRTFNFKRVRVVNALSIEALNKSTSSIKSLPNPLNPTVKPLSAGTKSKSNSIHPDSKPVPKTVVEPLKPKVKPLSINLDTCGGTPETIVELLKKCRAEFKALNPKNKMQVQSLADNFAIMALSIDAWVIAPKSNKVQYKKDKQLLNEILNFKNEVRAACIDKGEKGLKGNYPVGKKLLNDKDQEILKHALKFLRENVLKKYFSERLEKDQAKLAELHLRFKENKDKNVFNGQEAFLAKQLQRYQAKLDSGKPIALPKWYHCTKTSPILNTILQTYILYMHKGMFPGSFVANLPEFISYGDYCIGLSEHIETTATRNPGSKTLVLPKPSQMNPGIKYPIKYSDTWIAPQDNDYKNNQEGIGIWLGFQRGAATLGKGGYQVGTDGIPLKCQERVCTPKPLSYYKDTTIAFIVNKDDEGSVAETAKMHRLQALKFEEEEALRALINATFMCTLPKAWEGKI